MNTIKSKFRSEYISQTIFILVALTGIFGFTIYFLSSLSEIKFNDLRVLLSLGFIIFYIYNLFTIKSSFETIVLDNNGILIKNSSMKNVFVKYQSIQNCYIIRQKSSVRGVQISSGYYDFCLEIDNNQVLTISENMYENFDEIKSFIYNHLNIEAN